MRTFEVRGIDVLPIVVDVEHRRDLAAELKRKWPNWRKLGITINKPWRPYDRSDMRHLRRSGWQFWLAHQAKGAVNA